ncbi:MAG TPA: glycosyltransferase [Candidatus Blautia excrementipullorum]|nr:glycosyltransferase [Candidatus Blautia excrementipullorum]
MVFWTAIKNKLKRIIPGSRDYLDKKLKTVENRLKDLSNKWKSCDNKLKTLDNRSYELEQINRRQEKLLQEILQISKSQAKAIEELKQYIGREFQRRDNWGKRAEEISRSADGRPIWVIKCPAPEGPERIRWGDHAYAAALKKYLDRLGIHTVVDAKEDWDCEENADVVIVLRGCHFYRPDRRNKKCIYIMWNISHPEMVTPEEYELYDIVCICSYHYVREIAERVKVPVLPLLQCTDTEIFYPSQEEPETYENEYVFIGNSRGVARRCVVWASQDKLPLKIWGGGWTTILGDNRTIVQDTSIENSQIPEIYRSSKATLNDHWKDMLDCHFVNNRIFDALACGLPTISDCSDELKEIFPDAVLYYETKEDFDQCIHTLETDYASVKKKVAEQWPLIKEKYSFEARARELVEIVEKYGKKNK